LTLPIAPLPDILVEPVVQLALREDLARAGDVTAALLRPEEKLKADIRARAQGVLAGFEAARLAFHLIDPALQIAATRADGEELRPGDVIATVEGSARSLLTAERTALNLMTHLSGVATLTRAFVAAVAHTRAQIAATRKTLPGLRALQKHAVRLGGGWPHRYGLDDAILIKDNHIAACGGVEEALARARAAAGHMMVIEVEVDRLDQLEAALPFAPHAVLLDNFSLDDLRKAVGVAAGRTILEASGGVTLATVAAIAETGVDVISCGALTHSAPALDIGLDAV
jgi:nicotinate-nucleotide pyrophosphorylase (carboxylating)